MAKRINVTRSSMPSFEEYCAEIKPIWESRFLTNNGPKYTEFQTKLKEYLKVSNAEMFANGHLALENAIEALGLTGEVITTPFTFASTTQAILRRGLTPVFCDIEEETYTIDVAKIEALITNKTSAIIPVHVYGNVCNVEEIEKIAKKHNLAVIYDAAHAFGIKYKGKGIGSFGDASMFSFHATKVFNTIEGGALTFNNSDLTEKIKAYRQFGQLAEDDVPYMGTNAKMTEFSAAMGICNLRHISEYISLRKKAVEAYIARLKDVKGIKLCPVQKDVEQNYSYFPVVFNKEVFGKSRDQVADNLAKEDIYARKYFYPLTSSFACIPESIKINPTPIAENIAKNVLTLPLYSDLTEADVNRICDIILK